MLDLGFSSKGIRHRINKGKLHIVYRSVYAVGRPELTQLGAWMAAVLACRPGAVLSHLSAALLWGFWKGNEREIEVSVPGVRSHEHPGIRVHRRTGLRDADLGRCNRIPVTSPICTLIDIASRLAAPALERAINEADRLDLVPPDHLRAALDEVPPRRGVGILRELLDRYTFVLTESELERRFLPIAADAGLSLPLTQQVVNGFRVDFFWPELGLVVETDGLRYHRTPAQQARDARRNQAHTAAGMTPLRFTHAQVNYEHAHVRETLRRTAAALRLQV